MFPGKLSFSQVYPGWAAPRVAKESSDYEVLPPLPPIAQWRDGHTEAQMQGAAQHPCWAWKRTPISWGPGFFLKQFSHKALRVPWEHLKVTVKSLLFGRGFCAA